MSQINHSAIQQHRDVIIHAPNFEQKFPLQKIFFLSRLTVDSSRKRFEMEKEKISKKIWKKICFWIFKGNLHEYITHIII